jgi:hypothetical protein
MVRQYHFNGTLTMLRINTGSLHGLHSKVAPVVEPVSGDAQGDQCTPCQSRDAGTDDEQCGICLHSSPGERWFSLGCGHRYHHVCIRRALLTAVANKVAAGHRGDDAPVQCPLCRKDATHDVEHLVGDQSESEVQVTTAEEKDKLSALFGSSSSEEDVPVSKVGRKVGRKAGMVPRLRQHALTEAAGDVDLADGKHDSAGKESKKEEAPPQLSCLDKDKEKEKVEAKDVVDYHDLNVRQLYTELAKKGLSKQGNKADMVARLHQHAEDPTSSRSGRAKRCKIDGSGRKMGRFLENLQWTSAEKPLAEGEEDRISLANEIRSVRRNMLVFKEGGGLKQKAEAALATLESKMDEHVRREGRSTNSKQQLDEILINLHAAARDHEEVTTGFNQIGNTVIKCLEKLAALTNKGTSAAEGLFEAGRQAIALCEHTLNTGEDVDSTSSPVAQLGETRMLSTVESSSESSTKRARTE